MRPTMRTGFCAPLGAVVAMLVLSLAIARAQQTNNPPQPKPYIPLTASTVIAHPDAYYGQQVSVTATVERTVGPLAFSVDPGKIKSAGQGQDLLVLAPRLSGPPDPDTYVTVLGELVRLTPEEISKRSKEYKVDLPADVLARYQGKPAVFATAVITAKLVDLARRIPPPMSADEEAFDNVMKKVGPAFADLRTALENSDVNAINEHLPVLKQAFADTETFWKGRGKADAMGWAQEARKEVDAIGQAAAAEKWDAAKTSNGALGQSCQTCHNAYRERFDDGTFRIKTGDSR
jgi:cytochrome c556